ncbi:O-antigen ligase family protein [Neotamlana laminarinivorans]|uniref:O-antigen ligase family protein n=1 Tax=Neotamlana laminarinivorans TaxID=2883124 RepID=A0A9X1I499_9FLAO|nr:O-antigen ligase family protein [Tamlana laminarinivorans]MCB4799719.1 O-antigen ligase family protein [Tamlana laminarinivorans]
MNNFSYIKKIGFHVLLGLAIYAVSFLSKVYLFAICVYFANQILTAKPSQKPVQVLLACAYVVGSEVFIRMTGGNFLYEASKYLVILFVFMGLFTTRLPSQPIGYIMYLFLLLPGIIVAGLNSSPGSNLRTDIAFNLSGPVCLGIVALFCYKRKISFQNLNIVLLYMALPLVSMTVYLFFYTPDVRATVTGTGSNFAASGGFGPNQVSTVLGLGMFVLTARFFMLSPNLFLKIISGVILAAMSFRGVVTFSRGGILTALFMIAAYLFFYFKKVNIKAKFRITRLVVIFTALALSVWLISSLQTGGLIENRYANRDALGREKEDVTTGRSDLISFEFNEFLNNPVFGVGVGKIKVLREQKEGLLAASHNEVSRILAEHGLFGVFAFLILLLAPMVLRFKNKNNVFFYSFYLFWFLTVNHSAMRIAAPAFVYGLCLLDVRFKTKRKLKLPVRKSLK